MLMQISEPGTAQVKEACKPRVVGIDLGTTNSLVAHVEDGGPKVLGDDPIVPSVVWYAPSGGTVVGRRAQDMAVEEPGRTLAISAR
jgi:molecular chaperone HscA